jgi:hypothetical protein
VLNELKLYYSDKIFISVITKQIRCTLKSCNCYDCCHCFLSIFRCSIEGRIQELTEKFEYGPFDCRDRPPPILAKHFANDRLSGTASQKSALFRLFPLIFRDILDQLPSFVLYKILRDLIELVLANPFRRSWLPELRDLCLHFQRTMLDLFPNRMIPKVHFLSEYFQAIDDYGPPLKYWCMRFEARHLYFKQIAAKTNNYKNIAKTLSTRHQLRQCLFSSKSYFFNANDETTKPKKCSDTCFDDSTKNLLHRYFGRIDLSQDLWECKSLWHDHIEYHKGSIYVIDLQEIEEVPIFAEIRRILRLHNKWWLLVDRLRTKNYNESLCAWKLETTNDISILDPNELIFYHKGLDIYQIHNSSFVSLSNRMTRVE